MNYNDNENFYNSLTEKQRIKLSTKTGVCIYLSLFDEIINTELSPEEIGVLSLCAVYYSKYYDTKPLPNDLQIKIDENKILKLIYSDLKYKINAATLSWINRRGGKAKPLENEKKHDSMKEDDLNA